MQLEKQKEFQWRGFLVLFYWLGLMAILLLLVAATYTWFTLSKTPRVYDMDMHVSSPAGLEIALKHNSPDDDWGQSLDFFDMVEELTTLKPCTWSEEDQCFYAAAYGTDGRLAAISKRLTDNKNANKEGPEGYYAKGTLYARSDSPVTVSLAEAMTLEDGTECIGTYLIGTPVWNQEEILHDNGGSGAEYAIRVGLRITPVNERGRELADSVFYIYEPNSDGHTGGATGYVDTKSIDGTDNLVPAARLITQTTSSWTEVYPVQRSVVLRDMGTFTSGTDLFHLDAGEMVRIELYVWLEGQDVDCDYSIGNEAMILAHIQFAGDYSGQSGLTPIN